MNIAQRALRLSHFHAGFAASVFLHAALLAWTPQWLSEPGRQLPALLEVTLASELPAPVVAPVSRPVRHPATRETPVVRSTTSHVVAAPAALPSNNPIEPAQPAPPSVAAAQVPATPAPPTFTPPDVRAAYLANPRPPYPLAARRLGIEGKVVLLVEILESGNVASVQVARGSGHGMLDQSALQAVERWRFVPARRGGEAVGASVEVPISFRLEDSGREAGYF